MSPGQWFIPWEPSLTAGVVISIAALLYLRGSGATPTAFWQKLCFWFGLFSLYAVLLTGFEYYAEHEFFMDRIQQGTLQHFGPFLIALAAPAPALLAGLPPAGCRAVQKIKFSCHRVLDFLCHPLVAVLLFDGLILFWLIPSVHFIAMLDWRIYHLMNATMVINGLMFWSVALNRQSRSSAACRIGMMLAVIPAQIAMGAVLSFTPHEIYPVYSLCGRAFGGITPLQDQQIGALILWLHGAMMSIAGILIVMARDIIRPSAKIAV